MSKVNATRRGWRAKISDVGWQKKRHVEVTWLVWEISGHPLMKVLLTHALGEYNNNK